MTEAYTETCETPSTYTDTVRLDESDKLEGLAQASFSSELPTRDDFRTAKWNLEAIRNIQLSLRHAYPTAIYTAQAPGLSMEVTYSFLRDGDKKITLTIRRDGQRYCFDSGKLVFKKDQLQSFNKNAVMLDEKRPYLEDDEKKVILNLPHPQIRDAILREFRYDEERDSFWS